MKTSLKKVRSRAEVKKKQSNPIVESDSKENDDTRGSKENLKTSDEKEKNNKEWSGSNSQTPIKEKQRMVIVEGDKTNESAESPLLMN